MMIDRPVTDSARLHLSAMADAYASQAPRRRRVGARLRRALQHARRRRAAVSRQPRADAAAEGSKATPPARVPRRSATTCSDLDYAPRRGVDRAVHPATRRRPLDFEHHNVLITAPRASAKPFWRVRWVSRPVARGTGSSIAGCRASLPTSRSRTPTAPTSPSWAPRARRCPRARRLAGHGHRSPPTRPARDPRGPRSRSVDGHHQPAAPGALARLSGRPHRRRRHSRPTGASGPPAGARSAPRDASRSRGRRARRIETGRGRRQTHGNHRMETMPGFHRSLENRTERGFHRAHRHHRSCGRKKNDDPNTGSLVTARAEDLGSLPDAQASLLAPITMPGPTRSPMTWTE